MHFKISKKVFYQSLDKVSKAISASSPIPSLSGIRTTFFCFNVFRI